MKSKPIILLLAAFMLVSTLCACRSTAEEETAIPAMQTETQPDEPETQQVLPQEAEIQSTGQSEDFSDVQPEDTEPEEELSDMDVTENIEIEINENQGTGGL